MAGTVTVTERTYGSVKLIKWAWTSSAGGAADQATTGVYDGQLLALVTVPDGAAAPTDLYDITITDDNSVDVAHAAGANRSTSATEYVRAASLGAVSQSALTINISNAGNAKAGTAYLWIR